MSTMKPERRSVDAADIGALADADLAKVERGKLRVVAQKGGKDVASVVSAYDPARLEMLDRRVDEGRKAIQEIRARNAHFDPAEVERDIADAIAEMRADNRATKHAAASPS